MGVPTGESASKLISVGWNEIGHVDKCLSDPKKLKNQLQTVDLNNFQPFQFIIVPVITRQPDMRKIAQC